MAESLPVPPEASGLRHLRDSRGIVVRQVAQIPEVVASAFGVPWEAQNSYKAAPLPAGKRMVSSTEKKGAPWIPTGEELEELVKDPSLVVTETSSCFCRCLLWLAKCVHLRPLKLHFRLRESTGDAFLVQRPFRLGGVICCPLKTHLFSGGEAYERHGRLIGRVREDFTPYCTRLFQMCCKCTTYTGIEAVDPDYEDDEGDAKDAAFTRLYTIRSTFACCGGRDNCCAASCCKPETEMVFDVLDRSGQVVATMQRSYGRSSKLCTACCRWGNGFTNLTIEFPSTASPDARALLLAAVFHIDYAAFERPGRND